MNEMINLLDIKNGIVIFNNKKLDIVVDKNDNIWFNSQNICNILEYKDCKDAIKHNIDLLDRKQFSNIDLKYKIKKMKNFQPHSTYLNESGLYSLLFNSTIIQAMLG